MQLFVTILEETADAAIDAIRALDRDHDGIEVRAERFPSIDLDAIRAATAKPIILTYRGSRARDVARALDAGIDYVDVEWHERVDVGNRPDRIVISHHDYDGMHDVERIVASMQALGCAHTKLAATPQTFADNERLLALLDRRRNGATTLIGMGERGLYARILAPFRGSALTFVAGGAAAAPGQLTLARALAIYGPDRDALDADRVFAVVGNPAGHSLSPSIHNRLFREKRVSAAYTIASVERFDEITGAFLRGEPCGLSVTAPFKEDAFAFAMRAGAQIGDNARECAAVNTFVNDQGRIVADNTDVDGFRAILQQICGRDRKSIAIVGAGGTARAALAAAKRESMHVTIYNRTPGKLGALPLDHLARFDGEIVIDTVPADVTVPLRAGMAYIRASYGGASDPIDRARAAGAQVFDGLDLLEAQAVRQHELFMCVFA